MACNNRSRASFMPTAEWDLIHEKADEPVPAPPPELGNQSNASPTPVTLQTFVVYIALAVLVWSVFAGTVGHQFVNYDDQNYVYENPRIINGLTISGIASAFAQPHAQNWHPVTTISHMLDCQLFGLNPAGHHLVNVLLHVVATLLLFSGLNAMTGAFWRSAFVAAVFAIHPLRAESVGWISERKDVLSGVFFMLTLGAYVRYVRDQRISRYLAVVLFYALALMSKPSVVTLPLLLLLLDYWPLGRLTRATSRSGVVKEKIPLLVLSMGCAVATLAAQRHTVQYGQVLPFAERIANAVVSYVGYLGQIFWPVRLAPFYPYDVAGISSGIFWLSALCLLGVTGAVIWVRNRCPYLMVGWLWYLIALVPVIGIIQVGLQGRADRYTYLPQIGIGIALTWAIAEIPLTKRAVGRHLLTITMAGVTIVLAWRARIQASVWKDTETLWTHAIEVTENNDVAHNNLADLLMQHGQIDRAIVHYQAALRCGARNEMHNRLSPAIVENSLGNAYARKQDFGAAVRHYREAIRLRPGFADARTNLAAMLFRQGDVAGAIAEYQVVVTTPPEDAPSHEKLAGILLRANRERDAMFHYRRALELAPDSFDAINALAWMLATSADPEVKNGAEALRLAQHANELRHGTDPVVLRVLAASYAACGRAAEAIDTAERAAALAPDNPAFLKQLHAEIGMYRGTRPAVAAGR